MIEHVGQIDNGTAVEEHRNGVKIQSSLLDFLPAFYRDNEFMGQFLMIFESVIKPIENTVGNIPLYFDTTLTPEAILPWLASWIDLVLDENLPVLTRRQLVRSAAELYRWRGTKRGLREYIRICTGIVPEISEHIAGMRLGPDNKLGIDTQLGSSGTGHQFVVTLVAGEGSTVNTSMVKAIIDSQKPAHTAYTLRIENTKH